MRVIFNGLPAYSPKTGIGIYVANLLTELRNLAGAANVASFPAGLSAVAAGFGGKLRGWNVGRSSAGASGPAAPSIKRRAVRIARTTVHHMYARSFMRMCRSQLFDVYHEPNFIPWECDLPTVITVHDLSVVLHPEWHPRDRAEFHERHFQRGLDRCRHVVTDSECMRKSLITALGVKPEKVTAVPIGVRSEFRPMTPAEISRIRVARGLPLEYLLCVGTIEPRKNILMLLRAYCGLDDSLRSRCPLVLAGAWGWEFAPVRDFYESEARHRGVIHLGFVSDDDLPAICNGALAMVYPSLYEGFGLPPVEMMACGGAVLASTAPAIREVCGRLCQFIDPNDEPGWRDAMRRVILDPSWRSELQAGVVQHASRYTWERCAAETWQVYERIVNPQRERRAA
jgi:glycosyltransferase involved in cell wall biosynthesis